jgi:hypothetical protein
MAEGKMKQLPIGIQTFSAIREEDYVYIDKTPFIYAMTQVLGRYFFSRPRRFGKSLLIDTLKELFEGNRQLFTGLYIEDKWDWTKRYVVIHLSFGGGVVKSVAELDRMIKRLLKENQQRLNLECDDSLQQDPAGCLTQLIQDAAQHSGQRVVVLVDEYDKPILDNIESVDVATAMRERLKNIYAVLKEQDAHLQFVFLTGVTKFSKVSLFSGMNQLRDITLSREYATLCGYTQRDLEVDFADHLAGVDWQQLKEWYNGYHFLGESVYNPFDILLFISEGQSYRNYWFESGSPGFLIKLFRHNNYFLPDLESIKVGEEILSSFDIEVINPVTLLYQSGYLTIDSVAESPWGGSHYELRVPNREVRLALNNQLLISYSQCQEPLNYQQQLYTVLGRGDVVGLQQQITALFAAIPWRNFMQSDLAESEGYFASVLYAWLASINATIIPEDISHHGQADLTIILGGHIYICEFKLDKSKRYRARAKNSALQQIQQRNYAEKYLAKMQSGMVIHLVGLIFNRAARNLVQCDWQTLSVTNISQPSRLFAAERVGES